MKTRSYIVLWAALFALVSNGWAVYAHTEDWSGGTTAGWTANTIDSTVVYAAAGGNPDGHIQTRGPSPGDFDIGALTAIPDFTGNYAAAGITGVSVDLNFMNGQFDGAWLRFRYLDATQSGWLYPLTAVYPSSWQTYSVNFDPTWTDLQARNAGWLTDDDLFVGVDPSASFAATLANVYTTEVWISGDINLIAGIDNFTVVPEPATLAIMAIGGWFLRKQKHARAR